MGYELSQLFLGKGVLCVRCASQQCGSRAYEDAPRSGMDLVWNMILAHKETISFACPAGRMIHPWAVGVGGALFA